MSVEAGNTRYLQNGNDAKFVKCVYNDLKSPCQFCRSRNIEEPCVKIQAAEYDPSRALQRVSPCKNEKDRMLFEFVYSSDSCNYMMDEVWVIIRLLASCYGNVPASAPLRHSICALAAATAPAPHFREQFNNHKRLALAALNQKSSCPNSTFEYFLAILLLVWTTGPPDRFTDVTRLFLQWYSRLIHPLPADDVPQALVSMAQTFSLFLCVPGWLFDLGIPRSLPFGGTVTVGLYWAGESEVCRLRPRQNSCYSWKIEATLGALRDLLIMYTSVLVRNRILRIGEAKEGLISMLEAFLDDADLQNEMKTFSDILINKPADRDRRGILKIFGGVACLSIFLQLLTASTLAEGLGVIAETPEAAELRSLQKTFGQMDAQPKDSFWIVERCHLILSACVLREPYDETGMSITFATLKLSSSKNDSRRLTCRSMEY